MAAFVPAGTIVPFAGLSVPEGWLNCDGTPVSRGDFPALFGVLSATRVGTTTSGSPTVTGLSSTSDLAAGFQVTGSGVPTGATITAIPSGSSITLSANATASGAPSLTFTAWGRGDGSTTFNVPDLRGRALIGAGQGTYSGATNRVFGNQSIGFETHTLLTSEMPPHTHNINYGFAAGGSPLVLVNASANSGTGVFAQSTGGSGGVTQPHNNMPPSAVLRWIIKT